MSEQIREQVSAFLDGELPSSETELLLKRLTRDAELRESFGRYALIGEALRGASHPALSRTFAARVNRAIDGEPATVPAAGAALIAPRWWRPFAGAAVVAGVAAVAVVALQQRAISPATRAPLTAANSTPAATSTPAAAPAPALSPPLRAPASPREALSYTVPVSTQGSAGMLPPGRLTNYVFAHSKYSSGLGQRGVLADLLIDDEDKVPPQVQPAAATQ